MIKLKPNIRLRKLANRAEIITPSIRLLGNLSSLGQIQFESSWEARGKERKTRKKLDLRLEVQMKMSQANNRGEKAAALDKLLVKIAPGVFCVSDSAFYEDLQ